MAQALLVLGAFICLVALSAIAFPDALRNAAKRVKITASLRIFVFLIRVAFGVIMFAAADATPFPLALRIIGVVLILSGVGVLVLGNRRIEALKDWFMDRNAGVIRIGGVAALLFGAFIIYAVMA